LARLLQRQSGATLLIGNRRTKLSGVRAGRLATASVIPALAICGQAVGDPTAPSDDVVVSFSTTGSVIVDFTFEHKADGQHFCSAARGAWEAGGAPPSSPAYELRYDAGPRRAAEHFRLLAANYRSGTTSHSEPANDWISFWADGDEWLGHDGGADPAFKFDITFAPDGRSGTFSAHHLRAARDGKISAGNETVDVKGEWHCPLNTSPPTATSSSEGN
jgi:hypothetical protein